MADKTSIEWTRSADGSPGATWNPITGCSVVSPGCTNCYAMKLAGTRLAQHPSRKGLTQNTKAGPVWTGDVRFNREWLDQPLRWARPRMVFVCAHGDLFHESVPDEWIDQVFAVMAAAHWHTFQVLTKRAERMAAYLCDRTGAGHAAERWVAASWELVKTMPALEQVGWSWAQDGMPWPLPNVWAGVSAEDQKRADERLPFLLRTFAAVRWVSAEPLIGAIDLTQIRPDGIAFKIDALTGHAEHLLGDKGKLPGIDWLVAGGESQAGALPMNPAWVRQLRDQCKGAEVPFFFKQWGSWISAHDAGYSAWQRTGQRDGKVLGRVSRFDPRRGVPGLDGRDWPSAYPFPLGPDPGPVMINVGKANAGRLLDGVEHNAMPAAFKERT